MAGLGIELSDRKPSTCEALSSTEKTGKKFREAISIKAFSVALFHKSRKNSPAISVTPTWRTAQWGVLAPVPRGTVWLPPPPVLCTAVWDAPAGEQRSDGVPFSGVPGADHLCSVRALVPVRLPSETPPTAVQEGKCRGDPETGMGFVSQPHQVMF